MQFAGAQLLNLFREGLQKVQELGSVQFGGRHEETSTREGDEA